VTVKLPKGVSVNPRALVAALCLMAVGSAPFAPVRACAVPVYRYMLERWERDFYRTYYFYRGEEDDGDRKVNDFLEDAGSSFGSHVNLTFRAAEVSAVTGEAVAVEDREVLSEHRSDKLPFHLILSPRGTVLFRGRLDLPTAKAIVHSPMKTRIARELCAGKGGLLFLLAGPDHEENKKAGEDVRWVLATGKREYGLDVGFVRLSRGGAREKWLVRSLLDVVEEAPDKKQCMVFGICGRGRVLTACIGEGITRRNIVECVGIMNGDCSCDLRFQGAGMDLLTDWDWERAIASLPPVTLEPLQSVLLGFDDSEETCQEVPRRKLEDGRDRTVPPLFGTATLARWGAAIGIASVIVVGIGLMIIKRRKES